MAVEAMLQTVFRKVARGAVTARQATRMVVSAAVLALVLAVLVKKFGVIALVTPLVVVALAFPLLNPRLALGLLVGTAILFESSTPNVLHVTTDQFHDPVPGHYGVLELLLLLAICSIVLDASRNRRVPLRPAPFGPAIAMLVVAIVVGSIVGHYAGEGFNPLTEAFRPLLPLIIVPWLTVNTIRSADDLRRAVALLAVLTAVKAALGLIGAFTHVGVTGSGISGSGTTLTYYEPAANWLAMTFVMAILASLVSRVPVSRIARWALPLVLLSLVLSLRRSFWIGSAAAIPVVLIFASGSIGRRFLIPAAAIVAAAVWILVSSGVGFDPASPIGHRVQSLNPTQLSSNVQDRYRIDERNNVLAAIRGSPLVGLGLAVPWKERYPLSFENPGARGYVHFALLWFWLKLGIVGVLAYVAYLLTGIVVGIQVFSRHPDPRIRIAGAALAGGFVGLAVAETTATWLGNDLRMTVLIGFVAGLLSAARNESGFVPTLPTTRWGHPEPAGRRPQRPHAAF